ncbi:5-oxoprolinase/urea amidolyase family protein [Celerinatantimonas sp. MCCC 1A17872]|uniref:5-oxoprolinase subunit B/C family protein n=1 Tax=Celerinatantimonas sp. MCCC 1A17872 TaxID=3177514 RepID=UPI0038C74B69
MRFLPVNLTALLVELTTLEQAIALHRGLIDKPIEGITQMLPAARTVLIEYDPLSISKELLAKQIAQRSYQQSSLSLGKLVKINVEYNGSDLCEVANYLKLPIKAVIDWHTQTTFQVAFTGFAPGFAYLKALGSSLVVPRRSSPRAKIPTGSVALAGEFTGVYPKDSPGGWQLIGQTSQAMWDLNRAQPALLEPGDRVQFVNVKKTSVAVSQSMLPTPPSTPSSNQTNGLTIISPGLLTTFQDMGRINKASQGVSPSGAMDKYAYRIANQLVGNGADAAVLELTHGNFSANVMGDLVVALTGAPCPVSIEDKNGHPVPCKFNQPVALCEGDKLLIGSTKAGVRSYLAVRGGWQCDKVLESASFDSLAKLGPSPLHAGEHIFASLSSPKNAVQSEFCEPSGRYPTSRSCVQLDVVLGPHCDWFKDDALEVLTSSEWVVGQQADRIGIRLESSHCIERKITHELPSEGVVAGSIQVPANGQPLIFMRDHPLTGGYPVIACIADYHLDLAAQLPVGTSIQFHPISSFAEI